MHCVLEIKKVVPWCEWCVVASSVPYCCIAAATLAPYAQSGVAAGMLGTCVWCVLVVHADCVCVLCMCLLPFLRALACMCALLVVCGCCIRQLSTLHSPAYALSCVHKGGLVLVVL